MHAFTLTRLIREAPATVACLAVCLVLFFVTTRPRQTEKQRLALLDRFGAVVERSYASPHKPDDVLFRGPMALWRGEWWRIPISAFHHTDFVQLAVNSVIAAYLGWLLERRRGSAAVLLLVCGASLVAFLPEYLAGQYPIGFSGVTCALFGAVCVLRTRDEELVEEFPEEFVHLGGALLAVLLLLTALDLSPAANLAHLAGFFFGAFAEYFQRDCPWSRRAAWFARIAVAVSCGAALWLVVHPDWNGAYHWYLAVHAANDDERMAQLREAVDRAPEAGGAWLALADLEIRAGNKLPAWRTLLTGLSYNPTDEELLKITRRIWRELVVSPGRPDAEQAIRDVFGDQAATWEAQFRTEPFQRQSPGFDWLSSVVEADPVKQFPLDQKVDLRLPEADPALSPPPRTLPEGDAVEGRPM